MSYRVALLSPILLALAGCSRSDPPLNPQIIVNRDTIDFGTLAGQGTYIGTSRPDSLYIRNGGIQDLVVSNVALDGDRGFTFTTSQPLPCTVTRSQPLFVTFYFAPTAARAYTGTATIASNDAAAASKVVNLRGQGVNPPDGGP